MKKIKYIYKLVLMLPILVFVGCDDNEEYADILTNGTTNTENTVFIETSELTNNVELVGAGINVPIIVGVNKASSTDITVGFNVMKNGTVASLGVDYLLNDAIIEVDFLTGESGIEFLTSGSYKIMLNDASDSTLIIVNNELNYFVPESATIRLEWEDNYYDYGLLIFDGMATLSDVYSNGIPDGLSLIGYSDGIANYEEIVMVLPIGDSYVYLEDYYNDNADIPVMLTIQQPGLDLKSEETIVEGDKWGFKITTEFDGIDKVTHTITVL